MALVPPTFSLFSRISTEAPPTRAASAAESAAAPDPITITSGGGEEACAEGAGSDTPARLEHNDTRGNRSERPFENPVPAGPLRVGGPPDVRLTAFLSGRLGTVGWNRRSPLPWRPPGH